MAPALNVHICVPFTFSEKRSGKVSGIKETELPARFFAPVDTLAQALFGHPASTPRHRHQEFPQNGLRAQRKSPFTEFSIHSRSPRDNRTSFLHRDGDGHRGHSKRKLSTLHSPRDRKGQGRCCLAGLLVLSTGISGWCFTLDAAFPPRTDDDAFGHYLSHPLYPTLAFSLPTSSIHFRARKDKNWFSCGL